MDDGGLNWVASWSGSPKESNGTSGSGHGFWSVELFGDGRRMSGFGRGGWR